MSYIIECGKCWARVEAELFDDVPDIYLPYGDTPDKATQRYCELKWNARGEDEFEATVNEIVHAWTRRKRATERVEDARSLLRERNL